MALSYVLDHAQRRLARSRIGLTAGGDELSGDVAQNVFLEPTSKALMLLPSSMAYDFHAGNDAGRFKEPKSAYTLPTPGNWKEGKAPIPEDGPYLVNEGGVNEPVLLTQPLGKNRGFALSIFVYGAGASGSGEVIQFGVTENAGTTIAREFRLYADGLLEYWLDDVFQTSVRLSLGSNRQYIDLTVLPFRRRELLVLTTRSEGAVIVMDDIPEEASDPTAWSSEAQLYWYVPQGVARVQTHRVGFPTLGFATSKPYQFVQAPPTGAGLETFTNDAPAAAITTARVLGDSSFSGTASVSAVAIVGEDGVSGFTPNGSVRDCRLKVNLTGDGTCTPFVYGVHMAYAAVFDNTDGESSVVLDPYIMASGRTTIEVPDDPGGVQVRMDLNYPETLDASDAPKLLTVTNRPLKVFADDLPLIDGVTVEANFADETNDESRRVEIVAEDRWSLLRRFVFRDRVPLDGMHLTRASLPCAVRFVANAAGIPDSELDLEEDPFRIPEIPGATCGEYNFLIEFGDSAAAVLERLHEEYAASFALGFKPTATVPKLLFRDPESLSSAPVVTLYRSAEDAELAGVEEPAFFTYGDFRAHPLEIESNEVRVQGVNPRTGVPFQAFWVDYGSQDPTLAPSARPDNWVGMPLCLGVQDPRITTMAAAERCVRYLAPIASARRFAAEWTCLWPFYEAGGVKVPVWRWDVVALDGRGEYRVSCLSATSVAEFAAEEGGFFYRECRMTGIRVGTGTPYGQGGRDLDGMRAAARLAARNKVIRRPGWEAAARYAPSETFAVSL